MEALRRAAFASISRACAFAGLAIFCVVFGMSFDPLLATRTGGVLLILMTIVLLFQARRALYQDHRRTEMWILLDKNDRPPEAYAQWVASTVLRDTYLWFAQWTAALAVVTWLMAFIISISRAVA